MKDRLEKFIEGNRDAFNVREPDPQIWERIKVHTTVKRIINWKLILSRVAAVILIFITSFAVNEFIHRVVNKETGSSFFSREKTNIPAGLREAEIYYSSLVDEKMNELQPILVDCPSVEAELNYDMSELDSIYYDLKKDLKDNMANQEVIEAIIENYRLKINILEDILNEIQPPDGECATNTNEDNYAL